MHHHTIVFVETQAERGPQEWGNVAELKARTAAHEGCAPWWMEMQAIQAVSCVPSCYIRPAPAFSSSYSDRSAHLPQFNIPVELVFNIHPSLCGLSDERVPWLLLVVAFYPSMLAINFFLA